MSPHAIPITEPEKWESWAPHFAALESAPLTAANAGQWLKDWSDLAATLREEFNRAHRAHDENTADAEAEARYMRYVGEISPASETASQALREKLLRLEGYQPPADETEFLRRIRTSAEIFRQENVALDAEIDILAAEYNKTVGGLAIEWKGESITLPKAGLLLQEDDRAAREAAWRAIHEKWMTVNNDFDRLYLDLRARRQRIGRNAGFANYRDYMWRDKHRCDYSPADIAALREAIATAWKPLAAEVLSMRRDRLEVTELRPWDLEVDISGQPPLRPYADTGELIEKVGGILGRLSPDFGADFARMVPDYLDLDARPNKAPGGYQEFFPIAGLPYIFMNAVGSQGDVSVLLHEAGHAVHAMEAYRTQRLFWNVGSPLEFAEVASMGMELLAFPYYGAENGGFYADPADVRRAQTEQISKIATFLPYMAVVDEFQEWVYATAGDDITAGDLDACWSRLWEKYMPVVDWSGLETVRDTGWHRKLHIFNYPFYYIEYGLAQLGALQVWRASMVDTAGAVARYKSALALGKTRPTAALFEAAGLVFPREARLVGELADLVRDHITS